MNKEKYTIQNDAFHNCDFKQFIVYFSSQTKNLKMVCGWLELFSHFGNLCRGSEPAKANLSLVRMPPPTPSSPHALKIAKQNSFFYYIHR